MLLSKAGHHCLKVSGVSGADTSLPARRPASCCPTSPCRKRLSIVQGADRANSFTLRAQSPEAAISVPTSDPPASPMGENGVHLPTGPKRSEDVQGAMLDPSAANKNWVRIAGIVAGIAAVSGSINYLPNQLGSFLQLLGYAIWLGTNAWISVAGFIMFKNMPRQTFGKVQAKLFPPYFAANVAAVAVQIGALTFTGSAVPLAAQIGLGVALVANLSNWLVVEPSATRIMFERYNLENAPKRDAAQIKQLTKSFGALHGSSSMLNLVSLVAAFAHGWWLASKLSFGA